MPLDRPDVLTPDDKRRFVGKLDPAGRFIALALRFDADLGAYVSPVAVIAYIHNPLASLTAATRFRRRMLPSASC